MESFQTDSKARGSDPRNVRAKQEKKLREENERETRVCSFEEIQMLVVTTTRGVVPYM